MLAVEPSDIDNIGTTVKRRGRPRKNKIGDAPSNDSNTFNGGTIERRRPGRPRKYKTSEVVTSGFTNVNDAHEVINNHKEIINNKDLTFVEDMDQMDVPHDEVMGMDYTASLDVPNDDLSSLDLSLLF